MCRVNVESAGRMSGVGKRGGRSIVATCFLHVSLLPTEPITATLYKNLAHTDRHKN